MRKIILVLLIILAGAGNRLYAYDRLRINDSSDRRFLPYSLNTEYGFDLGVGRKTIATPLQVFEAANADSDTALVVSAFNPPVNADAPASIIVLDYARDHVLFEDPVYVTLNDFFVYPGASGKRPYVIAGCYRNDSAFVFRNTPGTDEFEFIYLTSGVDHTGNGAWEPGVSFLACEDYDFDGRDEAFFYVGPGRDLEPRVLYCIEVDPFRLQWSLPMASMTGRGKLTSCRDTLNPSVMVVTYGPQNGVNDDNFDDYYGYLTKIDRNGRIVLNRRILSDYNATPIQPLDEGHSEFCLYHDLPLAGRENAGNSEGSSGWLSIIDRDGNVIHSVIASGPVRSFWLSEYDGKSTPELYSLSGDGSISVFDTSLSILARSHPTGLLSFEDTLRIDGQSDPVMLFRVSDGLEIYSHNFVKLAFLEQAPTYQGTVKRGADGSAKTFVLSGGSQGMVVSVDRRGFLALLRIFTWEYKHYLFVMTLLLLIALFVLNYLRVRAITKLHRRERELSVVFENMEDCFYRTDSDGILVWHSPSTARLLEYDVSDELLGRPVTESYRYPEQRQALLAELKRTGRVTDYEVELVRKDGSSVVVSTNSRWWKDADGTILGVEGIFRDVTARREMERALRESEEKYRAVIEQSADNVYFFDPETGCVLEANESLRQTLGYTKEEMEGLTVYDFLAHDKSDIQDKITRALAHDLTFLSERRYTCKDGSHADVDVGVTRIDYAGKPALCIVSRDITERKRAEAALRDSEEKYRMLVESAGEAIFSVDRDMRYIFMNNVAARRLGYSREELIGKRIRDVFLSADAERQEGTVRLVFESGQAETRESMTEIKGESRRYRTSIQPILNEAGEISAVLGIARDITEIYEAREQLEGERLFVGSLLETSNSLIVCLDNEARITVFNHELELVTGYSREEVIGKNWPGIFLPEAERHDGLREFGNWVKQHPSDKYEGPLKTKSGDIRTILWSNSVLMHNGTGDLTAIAVGHDITERKRAEEALVESETRFKQALDKSRDILYRLNLEAMTYDYMSSSVKDIMGYTPEEIIAMGVDGMRALVHPDDLLRVGNHREALISAASDDTTPATSEYRLLRKDGTYRWLSDSHTVVRAEDDRPMFIIGSVRDITDQRLAQEALRESEEFNKTVIQHAPLGVSVRSRTGRLLSCNEAWKRIWNMSDERLHEDMTKERSALRFDDRDNYLGEWKNQVKEVYEKGGSVHVRELNVEKSFDFGPQWISQYFYAILDEHGVVDRVIILTEDITERKLAEEALKESEAQYRGLQQNLPLGIFRSTPEGRIISVNPAAVRMYGFDSADELMNVEAVATYAKPEQREEMLHLLSTEGSITDFETEIRRKDGRVIWISTNARAEFDADGKIVHFDGIDTDVTARKKAEDALRKREEEYRRLVEMMNDGLGVIDENDRIAFANNRFCEMLGYSRDELLGMAATDIAADTHKKLAEAEFENRRHGNKGSYELRMIRKDGQSVHTIVSSTPLIDTTGRFSGAVAVFTDITARKQSEELMVIQRDLGVALGSARTLTEAADCLLEASLRIPGIELGGMYIIDPKTRGLNLIAHRGLPEEFLAAVAGFDRDSDNTKRVLQGTPFYGPYPPTPDSEAGALFANKLRSVAVVPMWHENEVLGSLNLGSRSDAVLTENARRAVEASAARMGSVIARIQAQEALRESERRFREMADMLPQTVFEIDGDLNVAFANIQGLRSYGYTVEDINRGINAWDLFAPAERERMRENTEKMLRGEEFDGIDYLALRKDGSTFPITVYASRVVRGGKVVGARGIVVDITERKQAEQALLDSEERSRVQYKSIPVPTYTWEADGDDFVLTDYNDKALDITNGKIRDFISKRFSEMYPDWPEAFEEMRTCLRERRPIRREIAYEFITTGQKGVFLVSYAYVPPASVLVHTEDITERVRAERTLRHRVELERLIAEISTRFINLGVDDVEQGIEYALERTGRFADADRAYVMQYSEDGAMVVRTFEWCRENIPSAFDMSGDFPASGFSAYAMPWFFARLQQDELVQISSIDELPPKAREEERLMKEGGLKSLALAPMVYGGRLTGVLGFSSGRSSRIWPSEDAASLRIVAEIIVNALERRRAEMEVRRVNQEKITQAKQMAGGFAHEIRNALFPARGSVDKMRELLDRTKVDLGSLRKYPALADQSLARAMDITSLILRYTKLDSEKMLEPVELSTVVDEVIADNQLRISEQGVDVRYVGGPSVTVESNSKQLHMAINNLMINALDAMEETAEPFVRVFWTAKTDFVEMTFSDNGCGIPENSRARIFEAFYSTKPDRGTGIGLATVKKTIEMYGGSICVSSEIGHGTAFQMKLRIAGSGRS